MMKVPLGRLALFGSVAMYCAPRGLPVTMGAGVDCERVVGSSVARRPRARLEDRMSSEASLARKSHSLVSCDPIRRSEDAGRCFESCSGGREK